MTSHTPSRFRLFAVALGSLALLSVLPGAAFAANALLTGDRIELKPGKLHVASTDATITLGGGAGSADDPVLHGGSVRVLSIEGDVFDATYQLPSSGWRYRKRHGDVVGYVFRGTGPIRSVRIRAGKKIIVRGSGALGHTLGANPDPVRVVLTLGDQQYCMRFGGAVQFRTDARYLAKDSTAPDVCPLPYGEDDYWLCRPGIATNHCLSHDISATVVNPDNTTTLEPEVGSEDHPYDCFYVYPTVDLTGPIGNHENVTDPAYVALTVDPLLAQVGRFNGQCRIFAPHYRQSSFQTLSSPNAAQYADIAFRDVLDAWRLYLKLYNGGRNVVIMGHSQGVFMTSRLMQEEVDPSAALRAKLIVAVLIGGNVGVPDGQVIGGTFQNIPLCTSAAETGCVIAYHSFHAGQPPQGNANGIMVPPGLDVACTNPAALGTTNLGLFSASYFGLTPTQTLFDVVADPPGGATTAFSKYPQFYSGQCVKDATNRSYLEISNTPLPGDQRTDPVMYNAPLLSPAVLGTHILDYSWPTTDLLNLVATKASMMP